MKLIKGTLETPRINCSPAEWEARVDLACCYRAAWQLGWQTGIIYNHITLRVPGEPGQFLINPFGLMYPEITASGLIKIDVAGNKLSESPYPVLKQGFVVHSALHQAREDVGCVIHTHSRAGVAVAAQKQGLLPINLTAMVFTDRIAYYDVQGITDDESERQDIVRALGDKRVMIMRNHGLLTCGPTLAHAFGEMRALEDACAIQVMALSGGVELNLPSLDIARKVAEKQDRKSRAEGGDALDQWAAIRRWMDRVDASYRQ
jgi:ribulose-5-phosphate 4-epimerase/fuculose-1-phosphate aldolase